LSAAKLGVGMKESRGAISPAAAELGDYLRQCRKHRKYSVVRAAEVLSISKNTVVDIEKGRVLPELSVIALHARYFESGFSALLAMRLAADPNIVVRAMVPETGIEKLELTQQSRQLAWAIKPRLLGDVLDAVEREESRWRGRSLSTRQRAEYVAATYNLFHQFGEVSADLIRQQVAAMRPSADRSSGKGK
jgi:DNA-binding XRE family transcriptional regulator